MPPVALDSLATPENAAASLTVTVQPGDCLWSIAQRYLGAGDRYPEIAALNYGHSMGDGEIFKLRCRCTCSRTHLERATRPISAAPTDDAPSGASFSRYSDLRTECERRVSA